ncbi:hypothetical protein BB559_001416 [Furculomyces boomerangus]|uniref:Nucleoside diphosphate kinase n=1 Tax=Furculomyces boomerangus TaxID=61424 RepID=A0A2T9Z1Z0_9FUNG|nr:hypothetical protein BB559_001416 [Furculomyces boomerangus]
MSQEINGEESLVIIKPPYVNSIFHQSLINELSKVHLAVVREKIVWFQDFQIAILYSGTEVNDDKLNSLKNLTCGPCLAIHIKGEGAVLSAHIALGSKELRENALSLSNQTIDPSIDTASEFCLSTSEPELSLHEISYVFSEKIDGVEVSKYLELQSPSQEIQSVSISISKHLATDKDVMLRIKNVLVSCGLTSSYRDNSNVDGIILNVSGLDAIKKTEFIVGTGEIQSVKQEYPNSLRAIHESEDSGSLISIVDATDIFTKKSTATTKEKKKNKKKSSKNKKSNKNTSNALKKENGDAADKEISQLPETITNQAESLLNNNISENTENQIASENNIDNSKINRNEDILDKTVKQTSEQNIPDQNTHSSVHKDKAVASDDETTNNPLDQTETHHKDMLDDKNSPLENQISDGQVMATSEDKGADLLETTSEPTNDIEIIDKIKESIQPSEDLVFDKSLNSSRLKTENTILLEPIQETVAEQKSIPSDFESDIQTTSNTLEAELNSVESIDDLSKLNRNEATCLDDTNLTLTSQPSYDKTESSTKETEELAVKLESVDLDSDEHTENSEINRNTTSDIEMDANEPSKDKDDFSNKIDNIEVQTDDISSLGNSRHQERHDDSIKPIIDDNEGNENKVLEETTDSSTQYTHTPSVSKKIFESPFFQNDIQKTSSNKTKSSENLGTHSKKIPHLIHGLNSSITEKFAASNKPKSPKTSPSVSKPHIKPEKLSTESSSLSSRKRISETKTSSLLNRNSRPTTTTQKLSSHTLDHGKPLSKTQIVPTSHNVGNDTKTQSRTIHSSKSDMKSSQKPLASSTTSSKQGKVEEIKPRTTHSNSFLNPTASSIARISAVAKKPTTQTLTKGTSIDSVQKSKKVIYGTMTPNRRQASSNTTTSRMDPIPGNTSKTLPTETKKQLVNQEQQETKRIARKPPLPSFAKLAPKPSSMPTANSTGSKKVVLASDSKNEPQTPQRSRKPPLPAQARGIVNKPTEK